MTVFGKLFIIRFKRRLETVEKMKRKYELSLIKTSDLDEAVENKILTAEEKIEILNFQI